MYLSFFFSLFAKLECDIPLVADQSHLHNLLWLTRAVQSRPARNKARENNIREEREGRIESKRYTSATSRGGRVK